MVNFDLITIKIIAAIIFIFLNSCILWITVRLFKLEDSEFQTSLLISIFLGVFLLVFSAIPFLSWLTAVVIHLFMIVLLKEFYKFEWKKTVMIWLVWLICFIGLSIAIATVFMLI